MEKELDREEEAILRKKLLNWIEKAKKSSKPIRIVIPVLNEEGLNAQISPHFGRAPYFAIIDLNEKGEIVNQELIPNTGEHFGGAGRSASLILRFNPNVIITYSMGPKGLSLFQNAGVAVLKANVNTVRKAIEAYRRGELEELTEGCYEAKR